MAQLHPFPYPVSNFTHNAEAKMLIVEASDLFWAPGAPDFKQLYDDAADVGIAVYNPRTSSTTYWHTTGEAVRDADGCVTHWVLQPTNESCRKHPGVQCYTMHIYND